MSIASYFEKWMDLSLFFIYFRAFKTSAQIFTLEYFKNDPFSIQNWDPKSQL